MEELEKYKVIQIKCRNTVKSKTIGNEEVTLLIGKKIYHAKLLLPKLQTLTVVDERGIIRSFGYKGTPWDKDKSFKELFEQV
jgi:hypothetical protein